VAAADGFIELVEESCETLRAFPLSGSDVTDVDVRGLKRFPVGKYTIFYRVTRFGVRVSRILHQKRDHRDVFKKKRKSA
jgi:toxin ParE1/3/4